MKDLFLTPRGDLSIENISDNQQRLEINFFTSESNALQINFFIDGTFPHKRSKNNLSISFMTKKPKENKEFRIISGDEFIEQTLRIRLLTALGSLRGNRDIGSKLEDVIHDLIDKQSTKTNLEKYIRQAISDIMPSPEISIKGIETIYSNYSNGLTVTIINDNKVYTINV